MSENELCLECREAEEKAKLDIPCVIEKLESKKGKSLSVLETSYLCLYLCGCCGYEKAFRIYRYKIPSIIELQNRDPEIERKAENLKSEMSAKINLYIKKSMQVEGRIPSLIRIVDFFQKQCKRSSDDPQQQKFFILVNGKKTKSEIIEALKRIGVDVELIKKIESEE